MKIPSKLLILATLLLTPPACHSSSAPDQQSDVESDATLDAASSDIASDVDADASTSDIDASENDDTSQDAEPLEFDASLWMEPNPCTGDKVFSEDNTEFSIPHRPPDYDPKFTRQSISADLNGLPRQGSAVGVAAHLQPGAQRPYELFANPGTEVPIHLAVINNYEDLSSFRLNVAVMVDYEPVEANYQRWSPNREVQLMETNATGMNFPISSDVEILDITIPGTAFPDERMYEISLSYEVNTIDRSPFGSARRFALFNGGFNRPSRPCVESKLDERPSSIEQKLPGRLGDDLGALFFEGITSRDDLQRVINVQPGETRRMYLSVIHSDVDVEPTVLVPLLNGKPLGTKWWVTQGGERDSWREWRIDARKSFEVTFPEEPGIYEVQVASWTDPFELYRNRNGTRVEGVSIGGGLNENSNALRFRVVEAPSE